jgi:hypothetical protein
VTGILQVSQDYSGYDGEGIRHLRSGYLTSSAGMTDDVDCGWVL